MKKLLFMLAACLFVLASCEPDPVLTLDKGTLEFSDAGGSQTVAVTCNSVWNVVADPTDGTFYTVSPMSGTENGFITVTVQPNTGSANRSAKLVVTCESNRIATSQVVTISQLCAVGDAQMQSYTMNPPDNGTGILSADGGTISLQIQGNAPWKIECDASDKLDVTDMGDHAGVVVANFSPCPVFEGRTISFTLTCTSAAGATTHTYEFTQAGGRLSYGGEVYRAVKMKDGKWWMAENLRYIPSGMAPSDDPNAVNNGIWYPLVVDVLTENEASVKFSRNAEDIVSNGYLYSTEVALGLSPGGLTADNAGQFEGARGICPEGWHIPTKADIIGLVGKTAVAAETNENAPYYDAALKSGSVAKLNEDGFNAGAWGAFFLSNTAATKANMMGTVKNNTNGMNTGYIAGSTLHQVSLNDDGTLRNIQYVGLMPHMKNGTYAGAFNAYRSGVSVRCVKNE